jgi:formylglycine-generating enzyme required for sulfatase activity
VELRSGDVQIGIAEGGDAREIRVRTGSSTVGVRGGRVAVRSKDGRSVVVVGEGEAHVAGTQNVGAGSAADLSGDGAIAARAMTDEEKRRTSDRFVTPPADDLVYIPAGEYKLGGPLLEVAGPTWCNETAFTARVDAFLIGRTKVPICDFARFFEATRTRLPAYLPAAGFPDDLMRHAVVNVSWNDARSYARWCGMDLPSATQWEVAARGPRSLVVPWGDGPPPDALVDTTRLSPAPCRRTVAA